MDKPSFQSNFLNTLFSKFAAGNVKYCILRNYKGLPERMNSKDVDFLIEKRDLNKAIEILKFTAVKHRVDSVLFDKFQYVRCFIFFKKNRNVYQSLKIDYMFNFEARGAKFLKSSEILTKANKYRNFHVVDSVQEAIINWLKPLIAGGTIKEKYVQKILLTAKGKRIEFKTYMKRILGDSLSTKLWPLIESSDIKATLNHTRAIQITSWLRSFLREPVSVLKNLIEHVSIEIRKRIFVRKQMLVIIGPDGTGKSTVVNQLRTHICELLKYDIAKIKILHFRPNVLPNLKRLLTFWQNNSAPEEFTSPHRAKPSGFIGSLMRLIYYFFDYTFGYFIKIRPLFGRHYILIFDRYYYDLIVDPGRSRIKLPKFIPTMLLKLIPEPSLSVFLDNDPDVVLQRKQELSREEIERQIIEYRILLKNVPNSVIVDARKAADEIGREVSAKFIEKIAIPVDIMDRYCR